MLSKVLFSIRKIYVRLTIRLARERCKIPEAFNWNLSSENSGFKFLTVFLNIFYFGTVKLLSKIQLENPSCKQSESENQSN